MELLDSPRSRAGVLVTALGLAIAVALVLVVAAALGIVLPGAALVGVAIDQAPGTLRELQGSRLLARLSGLEIGGVDVGSQVAALGGSAAAWLSGQALGLFGTASTR